MSGRPGASFSVVIPTTGRPCLRDLLDRLADEGVHEEIIVVVDRDRKGPAAARNLGWRDTATDWVVFLDDDVLPAPGWRDQLLADLRQPGSVVAVQGRLRVPLPAREEVNDWQANTAKLSESRWITADIAYRRDALATVGGFDETFPRAYREDADLAFRVRQAAGDIVVGSRLTIHPVRPEGRWISLRQQRGNSDDAYLRRRYGAGWHGLLDIPAGRRRAHAVTVGFGALAAGLGLLGALGRSRAAKAGAVAAGLGWTACTAKFVTHRLETAPGERRRPGTLVLTSMAIPPLAIGHWLRGWLRHRHVAAWSENRSVQPGGPTVFRAVRRG